jgi:hypothetical protein
VGGGSRAIDAQAGEAESEAKVDGEPDDEADAEPGEERDEGEPGVGDTRPRGANRATGLEPSIVNVNQWSTVQCIAVVVMACDNRRSIAWGVVLMGEVVMTNDEKRQVCCIRSKRPQLHALQTTPTEHRSKHTKPHYHRE